MPLANAGATTVDVSMRLKRPSTRKDWLLLGFLAAFAVYGVAGGGCFAERLPSGSTAGFVGASDSAPLPYSVVVTPWDTATAARLGRNASAYATAAFKWLQSSGAFASVRLGSSTDTSADFSATPTGEYCNTAVIPLVTGITLGLVPTVFTDSTCRGAVFRSIAGGARGTDSLVVRQKSGGRVVMGWAAVPIGFLPGWTHGEAKNHPRYAQLARSAIFARSGELAGLRRP